MTEDDEPVIFEFERRNCRVVKTRRVNDEGTTVVGPEFRGEDYRPNVVTEGEMVDLCYDLYMEMYEEPRRIGYFTLATLLGHDDTDTVMVDLLADAVDMGVRHAKNTDEPVPEESFKGGFLDEHLPEE